MGESRTRNGRRRRSAPRRPSVASVFRKLGRILEQSATAECAALSQKENRVSRTMQAQFKRTGLAMLRVLNPVLEGKAPTPLAQHEVDALLKASSLAQLYLHNAVSMPDWYDEAVSSEEDKATVASALRFHLGLVVRHLVRRFS